MSGKKVALFAVIALIMIYMAGGEALVSTVLQYLLSFLTGLVTTIFTGLLGLLHVLHIG